MRDGEDDPIDVVLDDEPEVLEQPVVVEAAPEEPPVKKVVEPDEGMEALKQQLERERLARQEAERQAQQFAQTAFYAQNEVQDTNLHLVTNAIDTLRQSNEMLKANYQVAMENNDFAAAADIQLAMSDNAAKLGQLQAGKEQLEAAPPPRQPVYNPAPTDPVEAFAAQLSPRSAEWVRQHPEYVTNPKLNGKMLAAHSLVVSDDIPPDSDEYFERVEQILGVGGSASAPRRSAPPAAPVSRSGAGGGSRPNVVHLTAAQREAAQLSGMTEQEYAKSILALRREGRLN